jgi:hypothetical protein
MSISKRSYIHQLSDYEKFDLLSKMKPMGQKTEPASSRNAGVLPGWDGETPLLPLLLHAETSQDP